MSNESPTSNFQSGSHVQAIAEITAALEGGAVCVVVTGPSGSGRSALCRELTSTGDARTFTTAILDHTLHAREVLSQLLHDFGLFGDRPRAAAVNDPVRLAAAAERFLLSLKPLGAHAVVIVDDADRCDAGALEMLQRLATIGQPQLSLLRLVLVGQSSLDERLSEPRLERLRSLVTARVALEGPPTSELLEFVDKSVDKSMEAAAPSRVEESGFPVPPEGDALASAASRKIFALPWPAMAALAAVLVLAVTWTIRSGQPVASSDSRAEAPAAPATTPGPKGPDPAANPTSTAGVTPSPDPSPAEPPIVPEVGASAAAPPGSYRIAVAAFRTSGRAERIASQLRDEHMPVAVRASGDWYQVLAGPYSTLDEARSAQAEFTRLGFPGTQVAFPPSPGTGAPPSEATGR